MVGGDMLAFLSGLPTAEDPEKEGYEFLWWTWNAEEEQLRWVKNSPSEDIRASYDYTKQAFDTSSEYQDFLAEQLWDEYHTGRLPYDVQEFLMNFDYENSAFKNEEAIIKQWMHNQRNQLTECIATSTVQGTLVSLTDEKCQEFAYPDSEQVDLYVLSNRSLKYYAETWAFSPIVMYG